MYELGHVYLVPLLCECALGNIKSSLMFIQSDPIREDDFKAAMKRIESSLPFMAQSETQDAIIETLCGRIKPSTIFFKKLPLPALMVMVKMGSLSELMAHQKVHQALEYAVADLELQSLSPKQLLSTIEEIRSMQLGDVSEARSKILFSLEQQLRLPSAEQFWEAAALVQRSEFSSDATIRQITVDQALCILTSSLTQEAFYAAAKSAYSMGLNSEPEVLQAVLGQFESRFLVLMLQDDELVKKMKREVPELGWDLIRAAVKSSCRLERKSCPDRKE